MGWISNPEHFYQMCWVFCPTETLPTASQHHWSHPTPLTSKCCHVGGGFGKPMNWEKKL